MNVTRRDFLAQTGIAAAGLMTSRVLSGAPAAAQPAAPAGQGVNMTTFAAAPIPTVRIGLIGVGQRGTGAVRRLKVIEGVELKALCDVRPAQIEKGMKLLAGTSHHPDTYSGGDMDWQKVCERDDIDLIYTCTPWYLHTPIAVYAMLHGKHIATEVPAALTLDECWQLVDTSERTKRHCMMLENCCYDFFELLTLNLARQGFFGELVHAEGAYLHDLLDENFSKNAYYDMWRLRQNLRNGNLYPTHGLGPVCQALDINRGDRMDYLVSMSSADFQMAAKADELARQDPFYQPFAGKKFRGNMNTSVIRTARGRTIMVQHDVTSHRPYSRIHSLTGTKAMAQKYPLPPRISKGHEWMNDQEFKKLEEQFTFGFVKELGERARKVGGHGGMDFLMDWRLIESLRRGLPLDQNVYDAATWSAVGPLTEASVKNRSSSVDVPDFTRGAWKSNRSLDLSVARTS